MKKKILLTTTILLLTLTLFGKTTIKIGVLANRWPDKCVEEWNPTAEYLSKNIPGYNFIIVPLSFDEIYSAIEKKEIEFLLANPSYYPQMIKR